MAQQNQAIIPVDSASFPLRRKRGRPRKHDGPGYEPHRRNRQCQATATQAIPTQVPSRANPTASSSHGPCGLVGQKVSGMLEGIFDAGYLLTVRVGETGPVFKGLVFDPRLSVPLTVDNDIAPLLPMSRSDEILYPVHHVPTEEPVSPPIHPASKMVTAAVPLRIREPATPFPPVNHLHESSGLPQTARSAAEAEQNVVNHLPQDVHPASQTDLKNILLETVPRTEEVAGHGANRLPQDMHSALQTDVQILCLETAPSTKEVAQKDGIHLPQDVRPALQTDFKNILLETLSRKVANDDLLKSQPAAPQQSVPARMQTGVSSGKVANDDLLKSQPAAPQQSVPACMQTGVSSGPSYVMNNAVPAAIGACSGERTETMAEAAKGCGNSKHIAGSSGNISMTEQSDETLTADESSGGRLNCTGQASQLDQSLTNNETAGDADISHQALIFDESLMANETFGGKMGLVGEAPQLNIQASGKRHLPEELPNEKDQQNLSSSFCS
ncbi:uncharacterized protein [Elaeis guineensis]|uniref:Uncharacterized protein LOC105034915 n=1 Tax=Elaeis guineensis var. tenera TaxID=51953 RepID=A0A6J0PBR5_ELAGV|nr:uncharacterized protein LOC105034915 [Elaeis guineensis]XP_019702694.1 uncharacterized protein LOC105034915 [Elaeis guineensis]XP_019702695.1 uncharacterized protein LOC105034915 [Elaeis guineensis]XP_019702696.1 uncharacterized protein LOC105034915 [Elaeis guineensis]XP_019702697.1 uncharacterized protein LOC105034915 [Elaeis guineensis]XP_019702698.1 uncharacterized protein LOC105034915 [Elaeis guineensis]XP_029117597.1 uncharacterized protein LOC105034915 [Elaeis guineensis]